MLYVDAYQRERSSASLKRGWHFKTHHNISAIKRALGAGLEIHRPGPRIGESQDVQCRY
jgi:hypothetical protein